MIVLPVIPLSARFRDQAHRESKRFLRRMQNMRWRDLRVLLLPGHADSVGAAIRIRYEPTGGFRDLAVGFARSDVFIRNTDVMPISTIWDTAVEFRRLRYDIYLRHAGDLLGRQVGDRPFRTETDADLAMTCRDGIPTHALRSACGRKGDVGLLRFELAARYARTEIEVRREESSHARMSRLAAIRATET